MSQSLSRRAFARHSLLTLGSFAVLRHAQGDAPCELRCSLDTAPSHPRNVAFRDYLGKLEQASEGQIKTKLFESGSLFPDLQVTKALVQGQVDMACPGTWTMTGFVPDADFPQLPAFYGRSIDIVHKAADGAGGKFVNSKISGKLKVQILGPWFDLGSYNWYSTRKPLNSIADLKGMKLRSPGGVLHSFRIRFFGGVPNVTAWPDVPLAMSQGTFDGLISSNESVNSSKLFDSGLRYSLQDSQGMGLYVPMVNPAFWQKLGPKLQETMIKLWQENIAEYRANTAKLQESARCVGEARRQVRRCAADRARRHACGVRESAGQGGGGGTHFAEAGRAGHVGCRHLRCCREQSKRLGYLWERIERTGDFLHRLALGLHVGDLLVTFGLGRSARTRGQVIGCARRAAQQVAHAIDISRTDQLIADCCHIGLVRHHCATGRASRWPTANSAARRCARPRADQLAQRVEPLAMTHIDGNDVMLQCIVRVPAVKPSASEWTPRLRLRRALTPENYAGIVG